jgi:hypothetical protein
MTRLWAHSLRTEAEYQQPMRELGDFVVLNTCLFCPAMITACKLSWVTMSAILMLSLIGPLASESSLDTSAADRMHLVAFHLRVRLHSCNSSDRETQLTFASRHTRHPFRDRRVG